MEVTVYGLTYRDEPSGMLVLALEPHPSNCQFSIDQQDFVADTSLSWRIQVPENSRLERDSLGRLVLAWFFENRSEHSPANEVFSLARLGLLGFRMNDGNS